jgi:hypothetical protein
MSKIPPLSCCLVGKPRSRREAKEKESRAFDNVKCIYSLSILQLLGEKELHDSSFHVHGSLDIIQPTDGL